jgi:hypothetical protein
VLSDVSQKAARKIEECFKKRIAEVDKAVLEEEKNRA